MPSGMQKSLLMLCSALLCSCTGPRASLQKMIIPIEQLPPGLSMPLIKPASIPHMRFVNYNPQIFTKRESVNTVAFVLMTPYFDRENLTGALVSSYRAPEIVEVYGLTFINASNCEAARKTLKPRFQAREGIKILTRENRMGIIWSKEGQKPADATFDVLVDYIDAQL